MNVGTVAVSAAGHTEDHSEAQKRFDQMFHTITSRFVRR